MPTTRWATSPWPANTSPPPGPPPTPFDFAQGAAYNAASQLVTSTVSGESTVWWYTYDANGNLTHQTPNGTAPADGQVRYTWDAPNRLIKVERYVGGSYEPLAEAAYDGSLPLKAKRVSNDVHVGQRTRLTMWVAGQPLTTTYTADPLKPGRVLVAADGTTTRRYLYGQGPVGECDGQWSYYLRDGQGSLRQVVDAGGTLTLVRAYKPFGAILEEAGSGASAYGYFGAWWDSGLGLLYWDGRYYDPVTGRFLSPQRGRRNPYLPYGMPLTMGLLAPLVVWSAAFGKQRRRRWWPWLLLLALVGVGVIAVGCEGETTPTIPVPPTVPPTPGTPEPTPSYTPPPTPTLPPTPTPTTTPIPETCTPIPPTPTPTSGLKVEDREERKKIIKEAAIAHQGRFPVELLLGIAALESEGTFSNEFATHGVMGVTSYAGPDCYHPPYDNTESSLRQNVADGACHLNGYAWDRTSWLDKDSKKRNDAIEDSVTAAGFDDDNTWRIVAAVLWYAGGDQVDYLNTLANIIEGNVEKVEDDRSVPKQFGAQYRNSKLVSALRAGYDGLGLIEQ
jgi:RHS repeat-associated protein